MDCSIIGLPSLFMIACVVVVVTEFVLNDHTGPTVVLWPSHTSAYHSYVVLSISDGQLRHALLPDVTLLISPIKLYASGVTFKSVFNVNWLSKSVSNLFVYGE